MVIVTVGQLLKPGVITSLRHLFALRPRSRGQIPENHGRESAAIFFTPAIKVLQFRIV